jgi:hypothetical protein
MQGKVKVGVDGHAKRAGSWLSTKKVVLRELKDAFIEAKEIKDGKKEGLTLQQILLDK